MSISIGQTVGVALPSAALPQPDAANSGTVDAFNALMSQSAEPASATAGTVASQPQATNVPLADLLQSVQDSLMNNIPTDCARQRQLLDDAINS